MKSILLATVLLSLCASAAFAGAGDGTVEGKVYGDARGKGNWGKAEPAEVGMGSNHVTLQSTASGHVGIDLRVRPKKGVKAVKEIDVYYRTQNYLDHVSLVVVCQTNFGEEIRRGDIVLSNKKLGDYLLARLTAEKLGLAKGDEIKRILVNSNSANGAGNAIGAVIIKTDRGDVKPEDIQLKVGDGLFNWQEN